MKLHMIAAASLFVGTSAFAQTAALDKTSEAEVIEAKYAAAAAAKSGMGGPLEELDLTTRPAAHNYPPCEPGPGDDNCLQLYEPGVRAQLAAWNAPTGGLLAHSATTAMGGPYEPVIDHEAELASADTVTDGAVAHHAYEGMGGPEAESGYPPCSPGPGDDRCIQLYERGVTGAGN